MATIFKYKDKYYQTTNLDKKLKRLKISNKDIKILFEGDVDKNELERLFIKLTQEEKEIPNESWHNPTLYKFYNPSTKETIVSIYDNLDHLPINKNEWTRI